MPLRILVVDDNRDTLRTYVKALLRRIKPTEWDRGLPDRISHPPLEVQEADTVSVALEKLKTQAFEILVVDLKIPGISGEEMGGLEIISESMRLDPLRPIIVITGYGSVELARKTLTQGVFDFIEKSGTAVDDLTQTVQRAIDYRKEKIVRAGNPFAPMTGMEPTAFGGRTKELEFFEERLDRTLHTRFSAHFLVLGEWGIGKSTLLKEYKKISRSRGHVASLVPLEPFQSGATLVEVGHSIVEGILRDLPYPVQRFRKVLEFFDSFGITVLGSGLHFRRDTSRREFSTQAFLHDTLISLWQDLEDKTGVFVILIDDLDNLIKVPEIVMTLKQTFSMDSIMQTKILLGIASTPTNWLSLTSTEKHHPLSRYFMSRVELFNLSEDELQETILKSLVGTGVSFSPEVITRVFESTEGHPFEMQVLCYHLFNNQLFGRVEVDVWDKALQAALNEIGFAVFDHWFGKASGEEAKVLHVIAREETPMTTKEIQKMAEATELRVSSQNVAKYLQRLAEKRLIIKSDRGLYSIPDRMFCSYICTRSS